MDSDLCDRAWHATKRKETADPATFRSARRESLADPATLRKFAINERSSALVPRVIRATIIESARARRRSVRLLTRLFER